MARITGSSDREKRKSRSSNRPITQGQNPQRSNRQGVSQATVSNADARTRTGTAKVTSGQEPPKPVTRQSRVNGRLVAGTDKRQLPSQKPAAKPAGPTPYQVSDPWANPKRASIGNVRGPASSPNRPDGPTGPVRASIGNVKGPASSPNRPAGTPKTSAKPAGNFRAPSIPNPSTSSPKPPGRLASGLSNVVSPRGVGANAVVSGLLQLPSEIDRLRSGYYDPSKPNAERQSNLTAALGSDPSKAAWNLKNWGKKPSAPLPKGSSDALREKSNASLQRFTVPATKTSPATPKVPPASTTASRSSSNSGSSSRSSSGSSRPSIRAAASAPKKPQPGQSKDMNENYRAWAAANPTLAARVKKGQSGYNAFSKDAVAGTGPVKDGNDYKPNVSSTETAKAPSKETTKSDTSTGKNFRTDIALLDKKKKK